MTLAADFAAKRVLYIDFTTPMYDRNSGQLRVMEMLRILVDEGHSVSHLSLMQLVPELSRYANELRGMNIEVIESDPIRAAQFGSPTTGKSLDIGAFLAHNTFDIAIINAYQLASIYLPLIREFSPQTTVVIDTCDIASIRLEREAKLSNTLVHQERAIEAKSLEDTYFPQADMLIAITDVEQRYLNERYPNTHTIIVPNIHTPSASVAPFATRKGLLFVGNFLHHANAPAAEWLCRDIMPALHAIRPDINLVIVGQGPPEHLLQYENNKIQFLGWVKDLEAVLQQARISVAPLTFGAGMKGKVGEALAIGLPIVTTSVGAEGMGLVNDLNARIADTTENFVQAIIDIYDNQEAWYALSRNGMQHIEQNFTPTFARKALRQLIPPTLKSKIRFACKPDWFDQVQLQLLLGAYCTTFTDARRCELELFVLDDEINIDNAGAQVVNALAALHLDPDAIPNVSITPIACNQIGELPADTVWIDRNCDHFEAAMFNATLSPADALCGSHI